MTSCSRPLFNLTFVFHKFLGALDSSINFHGFNWEICVMNVSIGRLDSEMCVCLCLSDYVDEKYHICITSAAEFFTNMNMKYVLPLFHRETSGYKEVHQ